MHHPPSPPAPRRFAQKLAREVPWPLLAARRRGGGVRRRGLDGPPDVRERRGSVAGAIYMVRRTFVDVWGPFDKARAPWRRPPSGCGFDADARVASAARKDREMRREVWCNLRRGPAAFRRALVARAPDGAGRRPTLAPLDDLDMLYECSERVRSIQLLTWASSGALTFSPAPAGASFRSPTRPFSSTCVATGARQASGGFALRSLVGSRRLARRRFRRLRLGSDS